MIPILLTLPHAAWEKIGQHPLVASLATVYALFTLVLGPLWPLRILLKTMGFGAEGIILGSKAARVKARIGNVVAGSLFAGLQALGATIGL